MDLHEPIDEVKKFNSLPRTKLAPSGSVPNAWHFDIRYVQLEPAPAHLLIIIQPESRFLLTENLPAGSHPGTTESFAFFPDTPEDAAPEIVKALMRAFSGKSTVNIGGTQKQHFEDPRAPWALMTEDRRLARAVGNEFKRVGALSGLHTISVSPKSTCRITNKSFEQIFKDVMQALQLPPFAAAAIQIPQSIAFDYKVNEQPSDLHLAMDPDIPLDEYTKIMAYTQFFERSLPITKERLDEQLVPGRFMVLIDEAEALVKSKPFDELKRNGSPSALLDLAVRIYFGIGCELNRQLCYANLIKAAFHPDADASLKATAHAAIVAWLLDCTEELRGRYLYGAMHHANKAIQYSRPLCVLGHSIPTVAWQTRHLFRPMSERVVELNFFYNDIWQAEKEAEERIQRDSEANILRMKNPLRYKCANYGCGIEADRGKMLQKCGGKCDEDKKPYYCSKKCQKDDWKNHKRFCKPGMPCSVIESDHRETGSGGRAGKDGALRVTVPRPGGGSIVLSSSTMSPDLMRQIRDQAQKEVQESEMTS